MASLTLSIPWDHFTDKDLTLGVTSVCLERMTGVDLDLGSALALQDTISMNHKVSQGCHSCQNAVSFSVYDD
jgi:hypothetical protein